MALKAPCILLQGGHLSIVTPPDDSNSGTHIEYYRYFCSSRQICCIDI